MRYLIALLIVGCLACSTDQRTTIVSPATAVTDTVAVEHTHGFVTVRWVVPQSHGRLVYCGVFVGERWPTLFVVGNAVPKNGQYYMQATFEWRFDTLAVQPVWWDSRGGEHRED